MKSLKGTQTLENLMRAFAGESQARNRYTMYGSIAGKEGYAQIESLFLETAENERLHAKRFFDLLVEGLQGELPASVEIHAEYPVAKGNTLENLKAAAAGENEEWTRAYPEFGNIASQEGFPEVAAAFKLITKIEERHEARFLKLAENVADEKVFKKDGKVYWICRKCGHVHEGTSAPEKCPTCLHPKGYFEILAENY